MISLLVLVKYKVECCGMNFRALRVMPPLVVVLLPYGHVLVDCNHGYRLSEMLCIAVSERLKRRLHLNRYNQVANNDPRPCRQKCF